MDLVSYYYFFYIFDYVDDKIKDVTANKDEKILGILVNENFILFNFVNFVVDVNIIIFSIFNKDMN